MSVSERLETIEKTIRQIHQDIAGKRRSEQATVRMVLTIAFGIYTVLAAFGYFFYVRQRESVRFWYFKIFLILVAPIFL